MHYLLPLLIVLVAAGPPIVRTVCITVVKLQPYRQARHFGDLASRSRGQKAKDAQRIARDYSRHPRRDDVPAAPPSPVEKKDD